MNLSHTINAVSNAAAHALDARRDLQEALNTAGPVEAIIILELITEATTQWARSVALKKALESGL